jgi:hypothetical protein
VPLPGRQNFATRVVTYAFWLMTTVSFALGLGLLALDHTSTLRMKLASVGAGVVSAALFGAFVTLFVNRESKSLLESTLGSLFAEQRDAIFNLLSAASKVHLPAREYPPTESFDPDFMTDLMQDLQVSSTFQFRGSSGKWVAPYINYCRKTFTEVNVLMLDPQNMRALRQRAADRLLIPKNTRRTMDEVVDEIRREVLRTVVALFDLRDMCKVRLSLDSTLVSVVRIERTDDAIYVGLYHASPGRAAVNPTTYRFVRGSITCETYSLELARQLEFAEKRITFDRSHDDADLVRTFKSIGITIGMDEIAELRLEAKAFEDAFFGNMAKAK